jgi:RNA polymerase-binding transcription factor DksA
MKTKKPLSQSDRTRYGKRLDDLRARLMSDLEEVTEEARRPSGGQAEGALTNAPLHLGDMGSEEYQQEITATLLSNGEYLMTEVREAMRKLDDGRFGVCEECDEAIERDRLDAIPYARVCLNCARTREGAPVANINRGRPQSPDDTIAPEGDMGEDRLIHDPPEPEEVEAVEDELDVPQPEREDVHASGTAGGGTAVGGLAGTNLGHGDPDTTVLDDASGSGNYDSREARGTRRVRRPSGR